MTCSDGSLPITHAGRATDVQMDFRKRGGTLIMRRLSWRLTQASRYSLMQSMCQLCLYAWPGSTVSNVFLMKAEREVRISLRSRRVRAASCLVIGGKVFRLSATSDVCKLVVSQAICLNLHLGNRTAILAC